MTLRSLLLGSAALLSFAPMATAADAIVAAEPEPMEYVRVCDAFGSGYFYIPGTETCLKIGGYMRFDVRGGDLLGLNTDGVAGGDTYDNRARFALRVSTASDTELGDLKTYSEVRFNYRQGTDAVALQFGYIDLAGFRVGVDESAFTTFAGYAGSVMNDDLIPFGPYRTTLMSYTFKSDNGLTGIIALEDDESGRNYMPDMVAGAGYVSKAFSARVVGGYDESLEEGAIKARLDGTLGSVSAFIMGGWNTDGRVKNRYATWGGDWAVWGGVSANLTEKTKLAAQVSYDDTETLAVAANVAFTVVKGLAITPEVAYRDRKDATGDQWGGMVRFQRSF